MLGSTVIVVPSGSYDVDGFVTITRGTEDGLHIPLNVVEEVAGVPLPDVLGHLEACINGHFDLGVPPTKQVVRTALEGMFPVPRSLSKREQKRRRERDPADEGPVDPQPDSYGWSLEGGTWRFRFNPSPAPSGHVYLPTSTPVPRRTLHIIDPHLSDSVLRALVLSPQLGKVVEGVTGWGPGMVRVMESQLWLKPPRCGMPLAFHRDTPYFNFLVDTNVSSGVDVPVEVCTLWITFDDVSTWDVAVSRGALEYVRGSHRWGVGSSSSTSRVVPLWRSADYIEEENGEDGTSDGEDVLNGAISDNTTPKGLQKVFFDTDYHAPMHSAAVQMYKGVIPPSLSRVEDVGGTRKQRARQLHHLQRTGYLAPPSTTTYIGCVPPSPLTSPTTTDTPPPMTHLVQLLAGGATIHNGNTWHGSGANCGTTSDHWRRGIGIHYVRATAHFKACYAEDSTIAGTRPLSAMWADHKQPGTLSLNPERFPVVN